MVGQTPWSARVPLDPFFEESQRVGHGKTKRHEAVSPTNVVVNAGKLTHYLWNQAGHGHTRHIGFRSRAPLQPEACSGAVTNLGSPASH